MVSLELAELVKLRAPSVEKIYRRNIYEKPH